MQEHGDTGSDVGGIVNLEQSVHKVDIEVDVDVGSAHTSFSGCSSVSERLQVGLVQRLAVGRAVGSGVSDGGAYLSEDGRVDSSCEACVPEIGVGANPVVADRSIGIENERVPLSCEDLNGVDCEGLDVDSVDFDNCLMGRRLMAAVNFQEVTHHYMSVDGENEIGIARDRDEPEAVSPVTVDVDNSEVCCWPSQKATLPID